MKRLIVFSIAVFMFALTGLSQTVKVGGNISIIIHGQNGGYPDYGNGYNSYHMPVMSPAEFNFAMQTIANQSFDSGKLDVAQQIINSHNLYSFQVQQIMHQFSFDSSRLKFAKMAYGQTIDKGNYYMVNNAFTFSSSVNELNKFLMGM